MRSATLPKKKAMNENTYFTSIYCKYLYLIFPFRYKTTLK